MTVLHRYNIPYYAPDVSRTFTVYNNDSTPLITSGADVLDRFANGYYGTVEYTPESAFQVSEPLNPTIPAGGSDSFTIRSSKSLAHEEYTRRIIKDAAGAPLYAFDLIVNAQEYPRGEPEVAVQGESSLQITDCGRSVQHDLGRDVHARTALKHRRPDRTDV